MHAISTKGLTLVYLVIPLFFVVILGDHYLFEGVLRAMLPRHPEQLLWYTLLFNVPHFFASFFTFADKEYLAVYKKKLLLGIPLIALMAFLFPLVSINLTVLYLVLYTMYHNVSQQTGIASLVMKCRGWRVTTWRYANIILGLYLYALVYPSPFSHVVHLYALPVISVLSIISVMLTFLIARKSATPEGKYYAWGTSSIAGIGILAYALGYPFFVSTALRIVHDLTAFIFYIIHDMNRNRVIMHNLIYRFILPKTSLFVVGIPALAVLLTYFAQGEGTSMVIQAFFLLAVSHFYIEGFMWKNGSPHRAALTFQYSPHGIV